MGKVNSDYPFREIIRRARMGREAIYPYANDEKRFSILGASLSTMQKRYYTLQDILVIPPQFTPKRLEKSIDLIFREPYFRDVSTVVEIGGLKTTLPVIQASMGSPEDWNKVASLSAQACAELGLIYGIGENVVTSWGYDKRIDKSQPCFKERMISYFEHCDTKIGGIVIQQNEEDAFNELWNKIYSDPDLTEFVHQGRIAFEIKGGQGAKAGIGGERIVDRETALRLNDKYIIYPDPEEVETDVYERHSAPDIFTQEILIHRIKKLKNDYPRVKVWFKTGPYRDLDQVIPLVEKAGAHCIVIDGKEGGTGMSPSVTIDHLGMPTLSCLQRILKAKQNGSKISMIISGRINSGADVVKALALGADGVAMGRPFLIACYSNRLANLVFGRELYRFRFLKKIGKIFFKPNETSINYIHNLIAAIKLEIQLLTSSVGKYNIDDLSPEDVGTTKLDLAEIFGIQNTFSEDLFNGID